ncbi:MAG: hypothetical protein HY048_09060 [Acidobacteria bacterium]|nr:hypothetical protein [Acidobacteriota bacterium]
MRAPWRGRLLVSAAVLYFAIAAGALTSGQKPAPMPGVLHEHPAIQYIGRPTTDRVATLNQSLAAGGRALQRDDRTGYLRAVLEALDVPEGSQLLVFSKTGVQSAYTSPQNPRALYFNDSVAVGYIAGAPVLELAAHDPQQGVIFYTLDQSAAAPTFARRTSCLSCHVSSSTLDVPGFLSRSSTVADDGTVMSQLGATNDVDHTTPHPDRWGGYYVTSEVASAAYATRAHLGNITFSPRGSTSNQVFVDWMNGAHETRGYLSAASDNVALLVFDHQMHANNLLTRLNWETRVASSGAPAIATDATLRVLVNQLADYFLFVGEAPLPLALTPRTGYADRLQSRIPKDRKGRSFGQLDAETRLLRYPCSYMIYSEAFDGLPASVKTAVYRRMIEILSGAETRGGHAGLKAGDRQAVIEILRDTKPDFPDYR